MCARKPGPAPQESKLPLTKASLAAFLVKHGAAVLQRTAVSQLWCPGVARGLCPGSCTLPPAVFALLLAVKVKPRLLQNSAGIPAPFEPFIGFALVYVELVVTYPWADGFCGPGIQDRIDRRPLNIQVSLLCFNGEDPVRKYLGLSNASRNLTINDHQLYGQHLCYVPNSFRMIVGNFILGDFCSTLWPSTLLRCYNLDMCDDLLRGICCPAILVSSVLFINPPKKNGKTLGKTSN